MSGGGFPLPFTHRSFQEPAVKVDPPSSQPFFSKNDRCFPSCFLDGVLKRRIPGMGKLPLECAPQNEIAPLNMRAILLLVVPVVSVLVALSTNPGYPQEQTPPFCERLKTKGFPWEFNHPPCSVYLVVRIVQMSRLSELNQIPLLISESPKWRSLKWGLRALKQCATIIWLA